MSYLKFSNQGNLESDSRRFAPDADREELLANDKRHRVLVTVHGGAAEAYYDASEVMVEVFDYDEYEVEGKDPDPYLDDLVRTWGFPDPRADHVREAGND